MQGYQWGVCVLSTTTCYTALSFCTGYDCAVPAEYDVGDKLLIVSKSVQLMHVIRRPGEAWSRDRCGVGENDRCLLHSPRHVNGGYAWWKLRTSPRSANGCTRCCRPKSLRIRVEVLQSNETDHGRCPSSR